MRYAEQTKGGQGRKRRPAGTDQTCLTKGALLERGKRGGNPLDIAVAAQQSFARGDQIHGADLLRKRSHAIEQGYDCLLVRHRDIAAAPVGVRAPLRQIRAEARSFDAGCPIVPFDPGLFQPETVDQRRLGMGDGIANHFGIGIGHF